MTTSTTKMFDEDIVVPDDYMLLGGQEKFTPNVPYRDYLTKNRQRVLGTTYVVWTYILSLVFVKADLLPDAEFFLQQQPEISSPPDNRQAQPSKPLPKVNFDTGAPRKSGDQTVHLQQIPCHSGLKFSHSHYSFYGCYIF